MSFRTSKYLASTAAVALALAAQSGVAQAQATDSADISVELLELMVEEGLIPAERAASLLERARAAAAARSTQPAAPSAAAGVVDVPYVPEIVRNQIRDEVKAEVMAEARTQGWVAPNTMPDWVNRISFSGDFRLRYQGDYFGEDNLPFFPDFNAINDAGGVPIGEGVPLINSTIDRERFRYRARFGIRAQLSDQVFMGITLASGSGEEAVSTNETMGDYFAKDAIWIDRAYLRYEPLQGLALTAGRMPNPFYTTDMVWDSDINPEGVALRYERAFGPVTGFGLVTYMPLQERELDTDDRFLAAGQLGARYAANEDLSITGTVAYYDYENIQSRRNAPGSQLMDYTAPPLFAKGNSVFNIRNDGLTQLAGLASDFDILNITANAEYRGFQGIAVRVTGDYAVNLAMDEAEIDLLRGEPGVPPGDTAWLARFDVGTPTLSQRGDWAVSASYRYIETDAVLDIFTDSDFGLGGTDVEGYTLEAEYGIADGATANLKWMSSDAIERPPFSIDVLQMTLETKF